MNNINLLIDGLNKIGLKPSNYQIDQFTKYYKLLIEWNNKINLTAITNEVEVIQKHFLDSLLICNNVDLSKANSLIDIGTGAGFPGLPIKIMFPNIKIVLLDSLNKRINFLKSVSDSLNLENIEFIHGRAEEFAHNNKYREQFDICTSRAVSNLATLSEYCIPYIKKDGMFIAYKSEKSSEEITKSKKAIEVLGGNIVNILENNIPNSDIKRIFVVIQKEKETPQKYPRRAGVPSKKPIM